MNTLDDLITFLEKRANKISLAFSNHHISISDKCDKVSNKQELDALFDSIGDTKQIQECSNALISLLQKVTRLKKAGLSKKCDIHNEIIVDYVNKMIKQNVEYDYLHPFWGYPPFVDRLISHLEKTEEFERCAELQKISAHF